MRPQFLLVKVSKHLQGRALHDKIWSGNETNLETVYKTKVAPSHLHEYCTRFMALDAVPYPPVGDWG